MKAVGVRTRDEVSRSSSSMKISASSSASHLSEASSRPGGRDLEPMSTSMDDLSSSDDEMHCRSGSIRHRDIGQATGQPVVLEDYTTGDNASGRKTSGSASSGSGLRSGSDRQSTEDHREQERTVIPGSASFDSGVEVNRAESEARERADSSARPSVKSASFQESEADGSGVGPEQGVGASQGEISERQDREGDAGANGDGLVAEDKEEGGVEKMEETDEDRVSNLQRKKMFDSMYRLVLDDDLLEVMNEEGVDDDAILAEKDDDDSS